MYLKLTQLKLRQFECKISNMLHCKVENTNKDCPIVPKHRGQAKNSGHFEHSLQCLWQNEVQLKYSKQFANVKEIKIDVKCKVHK